MVDQQKILKIIFAYSYVHFYNLLVFFKKETLIWDFLSKFVSGT